MIVGRENGERQKQQPHGWKQNVITTIIFSNLSPSGNSVTEENVYPSQRLAWPLSLTAISKVRTERFHSLSALRPAHSNEAGDLWADNWRRKPTTVQIHGVPLSGQFRSRRQQRRRTAGGHPSNEATAFFHFLAAAPDRPNGRSPQK